MPFLDPPAVWMPQATQEEKKYCAPFMLASVRIGAHLFHNS